MSQDQRTHGHTASRLMIPLVCSTQYKNDVLERAIKVSEMVNEYVYQFDYQLLHK